MGEEGGNDEVQGRRLVDRGLNGDCTVGQESTRDGC